MTQQTKHPLPVLQVRGGQSGATGADTEVVLVFQDAGKKAIPPKAASASTIGILEKLRKSDAFTAALKTMQFGRFLGSGDRNLLFVGLGLAKDFKAEWARQCGGLAWQKLSAEKAQEVAVPTEGFEDHALSFAEGMMLACYKFMKHKSNGNASDEKKKPDSYFGPKRVTFLVKDKKAQQALEEGLSRLKPMAECVNITRDWSNEPSNIGTPEFFAAHAKELAREYGLKCTILTEREARRERMGLFLAVGQGSEREGRVVILEYNPKKSAKGGKKNLASPRTIALIGKGVTFDSGGISIKPSLRMEEMKHDMTGAATVVGATLLAARLGSPNRIVTIIGLTENMPSGSAIQPGNVVVSRSGKTVEIINTDAEGRLVLADLLDYAHKFKPDAIVDAATLTGAVGIALGKQCCAILANDDALVEALRRVGDANGERIWQLPLFDEYLDDMKSDTGDLKNSVNNSLGGTIRGAMFLKQFVKPGTRWAHLDIAYTAADLGHLPYYPKSGASGFGVRTLAQFVMDF